MLEKQSQRVPCTPRATQGKSPSNREDSDDFNGQTMVNYMEFIGNHRTKWSVLEFTIEKRDAWPL